MQSVYRSFYVRVLFVIRGKERSVQRNRLQNASDLIFGSIRHLHPEYTDLVSLQGAVDVGFRYRKHFALVQGAMEGCFRSRERYDIREAVIAVSTLGNVGKCRLSIHKSTYRRETHLHCVKGVRRCLNGFSASSA